MGTTIPSPWSVMFSEDMYDNKCIFCPGDIEGKAVYENCVDLGNIGRECLAVLCY